MPLRSHRPQLTARRTYWPRIPAMAFVQLALACSALLAIFQPNIVFAATYGGNAYGQCAYSADCPASTGSGGGSTAQSGSLDVIINVVNNQQIPANGYEIIVKPAPDNNVPLQQVEVIVNGHPLGTRPVNSDGTVHIFIPAQQAERGDLQLEVIVTGQDGTKVTKQYTVHLSSALITAPPSTSSAPTPSIFAPILRLIRPLPNVVKYLLPYFLFLLLLLDMLLLILYARREAGELRKLRDLLEREHQIVDLKQTFVALTSHYLRSPLAILNGGVELLSAASSVQDATHAALQSSLQHLHSVVESLVKQAAAEPQVVTSEPVEPLTLPATSTRPMLLIPVLLSGIVAFAFDYLAQRAGSFNLSEINLIMQAIVFGSLAVVLYIAVRAYQLGHQKLKIARRVLADEQQLNQQRDSFIAEASDQLNEALATLDAALAATGQSAASKFIDRGQKQLHNVADKLTVASRVKGSQTQSSPQTVQLKTLVESASQALQAKAGTKKVSIQIGNDQTLQLADPQLFTYVLQTLIDNAIDYSPESGSVIIAGQLRANTLAITVTDQGPGIDPQMKFALFEAFSKLEGATTFNREGMGFSLYLDRLIMAYLHGNLALDSIAPCGTQVTITLPAATGN